MGRPASVGSVVNLDPVSGEYIAAALALHAVSIALGFIGLRRVRARRPDLRRPLATIAMAGFLVINPSIWVWPIVGLGVVLALGLAMVTTAIARR